MSVSEGLGEAGATARKPSVVLIFLPSLIAVLGAAAIFLGQLSDRASNPIGYSGYGVDERITGAIEPAVTPAPIIALGG